MLGRRAGGGYEGRLMDGWRVRGRGEGEGGRGEG